MYTNTRSPPPLQHPVPTHPAYIPEPPSTPVSPQNYQRFTSSPQPTNVSNAPPYPNANANRNAYTSPFQHQHHPQQSQQSHLPPPNIPAPNFAGWPMNDATAQFGLQLGHSAVAAGQDYVQRNVCTSPSFSMALSNAH